MADRLRLAAAAMGISLLVAACGGATPDADSLGDGAGVEPTSSPAAGAALPETEFETFEGRTTSFAAYRGTPLVVNFWASWCPPCIAEMPDLEAVHQDVGDRVAFVGVNIQDTPAEAQEMVEETGVTYDLVRDPDGALGREFGVIGMPSTYYVDAEGNVVGRHTGLLTRDALVEDLREHLGIEMRAAG